MTKDKELENKRKQVSDAISNYRAQSDSAMVNLASKIDDIISGFNGEGNLQITFAELELLEIDEVVIANDKVSFQKKSHTDNKMVFITNILAGGTFGVKRG